MSSNRQIKHKTPHHWTLFILLLFTVGAAGCAGEADRGLDSDGGIPPAGDARAGDDGSGPTPDGAGVDSTTGPLQEPSAQDWATFDQLADHATSQMQMDGVPGAAIAVLLPGKTPMLRGLGVKQQGKSDPVTADTLFSLASVSKMFAAATILALADKNIMSPADTVMRHLPTLSVSDPALGAQMTVHHLLCHTSGLGYAEEDAFDTAPINWNSPTYMIEMFEKIAWPMWSPPGKVFNYSNPAYSLAAITVMKATQETYGQQVKKQIFTPAGMTSSTLSGEEAVGRDHAYGHGYGQSSPPGFDISTPFDEGSNGVYSSARDMAAWASMLLAGGKGVLSAASVTAMTSAQAELSFISDHRAYGYGWFIDRQGGETVISHGGSNLGFTADVTLVPNKGFAVVVLMNGAEGWPGAVSDKAVELFTSLPPPQNGTTPGSAQELAQLAGTYSESLYLGKIDIVPSSSGLSATFAKWSYTAPMEQYGRRAFYVGVTGAMQNALEGMPELDMAFYLDPAGKGEYIVTLFGVAERISSP